MKKVMIATMVLFFAFGTTDCLAQSAKELVKERKELMKA